MRKKGIKVKVLSFALAGALAFSGIMPSWFITPTVEVQAADEVPTAGDYGLMDDIQDGVILHCFDWKYTHIIEELPNIAAAGFTSVQTSPAQPGGGSGTWWWLYQPLGFYAANNDLGTVDELKRLCSEAEKYGIKVVVDVVANHLAGSHSNIQDDLKPGEYWHTHGSVSSWADRYQVINGEIGMPDIKSEHPYVQQVVAKYIDELKSYGVDGIRWDAAKHIGLPSEGCDFWPKVTSQGLWHYGEILVGPDDRQSGNEGLMKEYTNYMTVTDSTYGKTLRDAFASGQAPDSFGNWAAPTKGGIANNKLIYWAESHDTWSNGTDWGYSHGMSQNVIDRAYAVAASRNNICALYFSRPQSNIKDNIKAGQKGSTAFTSKEVTEINWFHNAKNGEKDYYTKSNNCSVISRETGMVVVAGSGGNMNVTVENGGGTAQAGTYYDAITGEKWTVTSTQASGKIGSSGIAVLYKDGKSDVITKSPTPTISQQGGDFKTDTLSLTIGLSNANSGTYKIGNGTATSYTGSKTITIGADMAYDESVTITLTAIGDDNKTTTKTYTFTKKDPSGPSYYANGVYFNNPKGWSNVYVYFFANDAAVGNAWPGQQMTKFDDGVYGFELEASFNPTNIIFNDGAGGSVGSNQTADLTFTMNGLYDMSGVKEVIQPVAKGTVVVKYVDESGKEIANSKTMTGKVGDSYTTSAPTIDGYTLSKTPSNASGKYTAGTTTVTYTYAEIISTDPNVTSSVTTGSSFKTETQTIKLTLSNAVSGTYSVDGGPTKSFTGTASVVLGKGKIADSTVTVKATATSADGVTKSFTFTYEKQFNGTVNEVTNSASASLLATDTVTVAKDQGLSKYYSTNGTGVGKPGNITIDGDFSDWSEDMKIAQGAAWDVANHYKGGHENCVLDTYALYASWDSSNLYVAWQMVNTTDTWARSGDGPLSDGGRVLDVPLILALSVNPDNTSMSNKNSSGNPIWGQKMGLEFDTHVDHLLYMSGKPGLGKPSLFKAVDASGNTNYEEGCIGFTEGGIEYKMAEGNIEKNIWGLNSSQDPADVADDSADWVDYKTFAGSSATHDTTFDSFYEIKIPLSVLGIDEAYLTKNGIGAMLVATRGESALDCIPFDMSMLDNATGDYSADPSTSHEKDDIDVITADFASIGKGVIHDDDDDDDDDIVTELELNFGADKSAPQLAGTALTLSGIAEGGTAPYTYKFYVDGTLVGTKSGSGETSVAWTPSSEGTYVIKCVVTDSEGTSQTSAKYYDIESDDDNPTKPLSITASASKTTVTKGGTVNLTASAIGGTGSYKYSYIVYNKTADKWSRIKDKISASTYTWTAVSAGTRIFYIEVTDGSGKTVRSEGVTVKTTAPSSDLSVTAKVSATTTTVGGKVTFTATATGGSGSYKYSYIVYNQTTNKWSRIKDKISASTYTWTAKSAGTRLFYVDVTDGSGKTVRSAAMKVVTESANPLEIVGSATKFNLSVGDTTYIIGSASGGTGSYTYSFVVYNEATKKWYRHAFDDSNVLEWKATSKGTRKFYVEAKDSSGKVIRSEAVTITVK